MACRRQVLQTHISHVYQTLLHPCLPLRSSSVRLGPPGPRVAAALSSMGEAGEGSGEAEGMRYKRAAPDAGNKNAYGRPWPPHCRVGHNCRASSKKRTLDGSIVK